MITLSLYLPQMGIYAETTLNAELRNKPLVLLNEENRAIVISDEAEKRGIVPGQNKTGILAMHPDILFKEYNREIYLEAASKLWWLAASESSVVEPNGPEWCYFLAEEKDLLPRTIELCKNVSQIYGMRPSVGIGSSKLIAHLAALRVGRGKIKLVSQENELLFMAGISLITLPGIDPALIKRAERLGIRTAGDFMRTPLTELVRQFGALAHQTLRLAMGQDDNRLRPTWPPPCLQRAHWYEEPINDLSILQKILPRLAAYLARRLTARQELCAWIALELEPESGLPAAAELKLEHATRNPHTITEAGERLLYKLSPAHPVQRITLRVGAFGVGTARQLALLDDNQSIAGYPHERHDRLRKSLGYISKKYGGGKVVKADQLVRTTSIQTRIHGLGRKCQEPIQVITSFNGNPARVVWRGKEYLVDSVENRWNETAWTDQGYVDKSAYRILCGRMGYCELTRIGTRWCLTAIAD